jgi:Transposase, Mutator family
VTGRLGGGGRWGRSSPPPASSAAGSTRPGRFWGRCQEHPRRGRKTLNEILLAEDLEQARAAIEAFDSDYGTQWPKAVAKVVDDQDALLCCFDYPAEHRVHLRTTNPIERSFAPVRPGLG